MDGMGNKITLLSRHSLRPPIHRIGGGDLANTPMPNWILLDVSAYILNRRRNSTTATCRFRGDKELQVTFFPAHPPHVSYFCVHCVSVSSGDYSMEPKIIAMEGNHVLFRVSFGSMCDIWDASSHEYFVYTADGGSGSGPLVEAVPNPHLFSPDISYRQMGLLSDDGNAGGGYTIAALLDDSTGSYEVFSLNQYEVCTFSSKDKVWTMEYVDRPTLPAPQERGEFRHVVSKIVTIGGEGGTMAFVDLWHGIMLYDVLSDNASLRYVELPDVISGRNDEPLFFRDVAYVNGHIKFVCMTDDNPGVSEVATWSISMPATASTSPQQNSWICCQSIQVSRK